MRVGQNPAKSIDYVPQPQRVTVAIVSYIPFLDGYYAESLDVLKACLTSIWENTDLPYDLLVFDNASCAEVRQFLLEAQEQGKIQTLILSSQNVGKGGAWNFIFSAAPGEVIAYADSDIYFYPGWLGHSLQALEDVPNVGMVTAMPMWSPEEFSTSTIAWGQKHPEAQVERGQFLPWEDFWQHSRSLGHPEARAREQFDARQDYRLTFDGKSYYIGAGHFQFVAYRKVLQGILPMPTDRPMGQVRSLDVALNQQGYLRLSTPAWWVQHMGNTRQGIPQKMQASARPTAAPKKAGGLWRWKPLRRMLLGLYGKIFEILYRN